MIKPIVRTKKAINQAKVSRCQGPTTLSPLLLTSASKETNEGKRRYQYGYEQNVKESLHVKQ